MNPAGAREAALGFAVDAGGRTYLCRRRVRWPQHLGCLVALAGDPPQMAGALLQGSGGGLFEGDDLHLALDLGAGAQVHVATAAATIVHASRQAGRARQVVDAAVAQGAFLDYDPAPVILFPGARLESRLRLRVARGAGMLGSDLLLRHDPGGVAAQGGFADLRVDVCDGAGTLRARDAQHLREADMAAGRPGVLAGHAAQASVYALGEGLAQPLVQALRAALAGLGPGVYAGAGVLPGDCGAWARLLGSDPVALRAAVAALRQAAREVILATGALRRPVC